jgi:hypothetical protein
VMSPVSVHVQHLARKVGRIARGISIAPKLHARED